MLNINLLPENERELSVLEETNIERTIHTPEILWEKPGSFIDECQKDHLSLDDIEDILKTEMEVLQQRKKTLAGIKKRLIENCSNKASEEIPNCPFTKQEIYNFISERYISIWDLSKRKHQTTPPVKKTITKDGEPFAFFTIENTIYIVTKST